MSQSNYARKILQRKDRPKRFSRRSPKDETSRLAQKHIADVLYMWIDELLEAGQIDEAYNTELDEKVSQTTTFLGLISNVKIMLPKMLQLFPKEQIIDDLVELHGQLKALPKIEFIQDAVAVIAFLDIEIKSLKSKSEDTTESMDSSSNNIQEPPPQQATEQAPQFVAPVAPAPVPQFVAPQAPQAPVPQATAPPQDQFTAAFSALSLEVRQRASAICPECCLRSAMRCSSYCSPCKRNLDRKETNRMLKEGRQEKRLLEKQRDDMIKRQASILKAREVNEQKAKDVETMRQLLEIMAKNGM